VERVARRIVSRPPLTARELEILELMAEGLRNRDVADRLGISVNTVHRHVQSVLEKLDAHSKLQAVILASRAGLLDPTR
jgi:DNA-binding NarL/FixJ family response regulator